MRRRGIVLGLYADDEGVARVRALVDGLAARRGVRLSWQVTRDSATAEDYDYLAAQWAVENPGHAPGARAAVEVRAAFRSSLKTWRTLRTRTLDGLCPQGPHVCAIPWSAGFGG
ncbi:hypothetical protein [Streptomyces avicenniae]|uniref:hypothetical protein n=1 Tax=Streptomyces avicenniae TaxID=500153 RepID=UPI00069A556A|nr:hypothetical protein [Streptomyces avicenniae]